MDGAAPTTNGAPWWAKLSTSALAVIALVYIFESLGGRFLDILGTDMQAQRDIQVRLVEALKAQAIAEEQQADHLADILTAQRDRNATLKRLLEMAERNQGR